MPVLFESKGRKKEHMFGRTPYMQNIHVQAPIDSLNQILPIKITDATQNSLSGIIVKQ